MVTLQAGTKRVAFQLVNHETKRKSIIASTRPFASCAPPYSQVTSLGHHLRDEHNQYHRLPRSSCTADPNHFSARVQHNRRRSLSGTTSLKMATDDEYMDFLNKANEDPGQGSVSTQAQGSKAKKELKAADNGADIPQPLVKATKDAFYMSDSDEPFVPVSLAWEKGEGLPNEGTSFTFHSYLLRLPLQSPILFPGMRRGLTLPFSEQRKLPNSSSTGILQRPRLRFWTRSTGTGMGSTRKSLTRSAKPARATTCGYIALSRTSQGWNTSWSRGQERAKGPGWWASRHWRLRAEGWEIFRDCGMNYEI